MKQAIEGFQRGCQAGLLLALAVFSCAAAQAETVYKCLNGGKPNFTSAPQEGGNCQPMELHVIQPDPEEVARQEAKKRADAAEERAASKKGDKEKPRSLEAESRAQAAKIAEDLARQPVHMPGMGGRGRGGGRRGRY